MKPAVHGKYRAVVKERVPWGLIVAIGGARGDALIDNAKIGDETPTVGSDVDIVILDDAREPVRASLLLTDIEIARRMRADISPEMND